jgi:hypothetical protein
MAPDSFARNECQRTAVANSGLTSAQHDVTAVAISSNGRADDDSSTNRSTSPAAAAAADNVDTTRTTSALTTLDNHGTTRCRGIQSVSSTQMDIASRAGVSCPYEHAY